MVAPRPPHVLSYDPEIFEHRGPLIVHAVLTHSWHLQSPEKQILSVVDSRWDGPLTVRVSELPRSSDVAPGIRATISPASLWIGATHLSFQEAEAWAPHLDSPATLQMGALRRNLAAIGDCIGAGVGDELWLARGAPEMHSLAAALRWHDAAGLYRHAVGLLGLGPGLTPSGDDVLSGLAAGMVVLGRRHPRHRARCEWAADALASCLDVEARRRTTAFSATLLGSAVRGRAAEPLLQVLQTVGSGGPVQGVAEVLVLGHSSGRDMLTGALMAGAALLSWEEVHGTAVVGSR